MRPPARILKSKPDNYQTLNRSKTDWIKSETFYEYILIGFSSYLEENTIKKEIFLLVDGHKSHINPELKNFAWENDIILYVLLPNTTHIMQPTHVGTFKFLKSDYKKIVREWSSIYDNEGKQITKFNFCDILKIHSKNKRCN